MKTLKKIITFTITCVLLFGFSTAYASTYDLTP